VEALCQREASKESVYSRACARSVLDARVYAQVKPGGSMTDRALSGMVDKGQVLMAAGSCLVGELGLVAAEAGYEVAALSFRWPVDYDWPTSDAAASRGRVGIVVVRWGGRKDRL
jgi:hypothetical protein